MLMEQNVLRSNWPISDHDYPAGTLTSVEQQHFPSLMSSFHNYSGFPPAPQRFKEESPRTFGSLYSHHQSSSSNNSHPYHSHHSYPAASSSASSTPSSQLPLHHHHSLPLSLSIPRPAGASSVTGGSRKASEEERKAKHREAQRRFVKRKKAEMVQLKQLAIELELQHQLLEVMSERIVLERENRALESDIAMTRDQGRHAEHEGDVYKREHPPIQLPDLEFNFEW